MDLSEKVKPQSSPLFENITGVLHVPAADLGAGDDWPAQMQEMAAVFQNNLILTDQPEAFLEWNGLVLADLFMGFGPLTPIFTALKFAKTEWVFFLSLGGEIYLQDLLQKVCGQKLSGNCFLPLVNGEISISRGSLFSQKSVSFIERAIKEGETEIDLFLHQLKPRWIYL